MLKSVFTIEADGGYGTGFVAWRANGQTYLITAHHVVEDAYGTSVTVNRKGGAWQGEIVETDPENDLAIVRIGGPAQGRGAAVAASADEASRAGEELLLVGSPFGLEGTVTTGGGQNVNFAVPIARVCLRLHSC